MTNVLALQRRLSSLGLNPVRSMALWGRLRSRPSTTRPMGCRPLALPLRRPSGQGSPPSSARGRRPPARSTRSMSIVRRRRKAATSRSRPFRGWHKASGWADIGYHSLGRSARRGGSRPALVLPSGMAAPSRREEVVQRRVAGKRGGARGRASLYFLTIAALQIFAHGQRCV